ncbi:MAG: hypothetical protein UU40_C0004G0025 [Candidatus Uhrbacteria bacterium GW2011_GWD2_41_121]|uniref:Uncharacterized protein n=1 Tax=Candidatus Uhrbacteria bacterium GW2011_GWC1_41_20 TaxID=1618983 RepID=A0A0G0VFD9_9BACT|nr:MAG: hypothetical protein UT52_C0006G0025 [Candidatus Uhrbacteria bacterium GW2011_GWE1_39_46]KKR64235.1 MAG: hypothetical protein UU04_C0004G0025 [Candidatus Uhrbacteria bacterium GW2011_GWC2_40_450]KKR88202.1 MAG: hypothetical protein UU36_C0052G0001 [Candidatus Uhrbacteria bacterium GW2011_GWE2_41_1153]KKR90368.1 MAG: hypothetical protein UU40_C0004G0025 [Candidatus Uhrbacteria bacterium GW2011_GWD2_41_121]KKR96271.1 MAG: hypothetical protein UU46_C0005G0025 [Candidatus Uhrbacteria bacter
MDQTRGSDIIEAVPPEFTHSNFLDRSESHYFDGKRHRSQLQGW